MGSATAKGEVALSSRRRDLIDQPIVRCFERIDKSNSRQFKAILEVLGKQMANAGPFTPCPYNIASQNAGQCRIAVLRTLRGDGSRRSWTSMDDIRRVSPKAKVLNRDRARFEVAGGNYRLIASFDFRRQIVFVKFIGTHAEYDAIDLLTVARF
jgi:mRNA-degrading endonuclease HigB of HigAB toxin-antitoxin module